MPLEIALSYFRTKYTGMSCDVAWYDYRGWLAACKKTLLDFAPDIGGVQMFFPGKVFEYLEPRSLRWPGCGAPSNHSYQAVEGEFTKAEQ